MPCIDDVELTCYDFGEITGTTHCIYHFIWSLISAILSYIEHEGLIVPENRTSCRLFFLCTSAHDIINDLNSLFRRYAGLTVEQD